MDVPPDLTGKDARKALFYQIQQLIDHFEKVDPTRADSSVRERLSGLVHSILCIIDGVSTADGSWDITVQSSEEDRQVMHSQGQRAYPIEPVSVYDESSSLLHDAWFEFHRRRAG